MTAEIGILNKQGIALAADSAVTLGSGPGPKIFASANKIFALSKYRPVGVMVYGNAEVLGVPWETVIKRYRRGLGETKFATLEEYVEHFAQAVGSDSVLFPAAAQERHARITIGSWFMAIAERVKQEIEAALADSSEGLTSDDVADLAAAVIRTSYGVWEQQPPSAFLPSEHEAEVADLYRGLIDEARATQFEKIPLGEDEQRMLAEIAAMCLSRQSPVDTPAVSGVVVAGYGQDDIFPSFVELMVGGVANDQLICWRGREHAISIGDDAYVAAFAQAEMVTRFMEGVDPDYQDMLEKSLESILSGYTNEIFKKLKRRPSREIRTELEAARADMLEEYSERLAAHRQDTYVEGVINVVGSLPLDELADMAESLVNLTSFKRRVSLESETVSGPIDVAVISAGDGFVWIKRKFYFDAEKNPHFLANYYRGD